MKFPADTGPCWADAHLDLAYLAVNGRDMRASVPADAAHALTLPALRDGGVRVAFGTIFTELGGDPATEAVGYRDSDDLEGAHRAGLRQIFFYPGFDGSNFLGCEKPSNYRRAVLVEGVNCLLVNKSDSSLLTWHVIPPKGRVTGLNARHSQKLG